MSTALRIVHQNEDLLAKAAELGINLSKSERLVLRPVAGAAVRDIPEEELVAKVGALLVGIFKNLQLRGEPEEFDGYQFMRTLKDRYDHLTLQDVQRAFECYVYHDLDALLPTDHKGQPTRHFGQFSMTFYVEVLNAYEKLKGGAKHGVIKQADHVLLLMESAAADPYDARCTMLETLRDIVVELAKGNNPLMALTQPAEEACQDVRLLPKVIEVLEEDQLRAKEALTRNRGRSVARALDKAMEDGVIPGDLAARARTYATHRLLRSAAEAIGPERVAERFEWLIEQYRTQQANGKAGSEG